MADLVTLTTFRAAVRERSDTVNSGRVTNAKLDRLINSSMKRFYAKVIELDPDAYTTRVVLATASGQAYAALPGDFLKLCDVAWDPNGVVSGPTSAIGAETRPLTRFALQERHLYVGTNGWTEDRPISYRLLSTVTNVQRIEFLPVPTAQAVIVVWYIPALTALSADADTFDGRSGGAEWIIWDAAIAIMIADESDVRDATVERDLVWRDQIAPTFAKRDVARPARVIDVDAYDSRTTRSRYGRPL